jgi:hypothetical protein
MQIDLRDASFDAFLTAVFDHPPPTEGEDLNAWYWNSDPDFLVDPARQVAHLTRLFREAGALANRFSTAQIEQGFWLIGSSASEPFIEHLWNAAVPWPERAACVAAMEQLYADCLAVGEYDSVDYMWTDFLAHGYDFGSRHPAESAEDARMQQALFDLFARLLARPEPICQYAALHGLGHLRHPAGPGAIAAYLAAHPELTPEQRRYAESAMAGYVQ